MKTVLSWKIYSLALLVYCGLIYLLSDQVVLPLPHVFNMQDKLIHAAAYAFMAWLFWHAARVHLSGLLLAVTTIIFCSLYGLSDEWHQSYVDGRQADIFDWIADTAGAFMLTIMLYKREFVIRTGG